MTESHEDNLSSLRICRICQEDELESKSKLLKPCKCNSHIHKECLLQWIRTKRNSDIIDYQNDLECEICLAKIKYRHATANEHSGDSSSQEASGSENGATTLNMLNVLLKKNSNILKAVTEVLVFFLIPLLCFYLSLNMFYGLFNRQELIGSMDEDTQQFMHNSEGKIKFYRVKGSKLLNPKYFPSSLSKMFTSSVFQIITYTVLFFPLLEDFNDGFVSSTLHKMYEYQFGVEEAINQFDKHNNSFLAVEQKTLMSKCFHYLLGMLVFIPLIVFHSLSQEFFPRYLYSKLIGTFSERYSHYFSIYYNFVVLLCTYLYLSYTQTKKSTTPYVHFIVQNTLKLVLSQYWQLILVHLLELALLHFFNVEKIVSLDDSFEYSNFQPNIVPSFKAIYVALVSLSYLKNHLFRYGVFYKFPTGSFEGNALKHSQLSLITPLRNILEENILDVFLLVLVLLSVGGAGVLLFYGLKPELFPFVFTLTGSKSFFLEKVLTSVVTFQVSVLKDSVYLPLFHKLGAFFRLSNYLFEFDRPLEKGRFVYRDTVDVHNEAETVRARITNATLYENPCFSEREAMYFLKNGNPNVNAYLVQDGYNIKVSNASSVSFFQEGLMKPIDAAGQTIVKTEDKSEDELLLSESEPSDEEKTLTGMFNHAYKNTDGYDVCFVPTNFKLRLYSYFAVIAVIQNILVVVLLSLGYKVGSFLFDILRINLFFANRETPLNQGSNSVFLASNTVANEFVVTKILSGVSILMFMVSLVTKNTGALKSIGLALNINVLKNMLYFLLNIIVLAHSVVFTTLASLSVTYFCSNVALLKTQLLNNYGSMVENRKILIYQSSFFLNECTVFLWFVFACFFIVYNSLTLSSFINKSRNENNYSLKDIVKDVFKVCFKKQYQAWASYFFVPFALQHLILAISFLKNYYNENKKSMLGIEYNSFTLDYKIYQENSFLLVSGTRKPLSIFYKAVFVAFVTFKLFNDSYALFKQYWDNLKVMTMDNTIGEDNVIILEDES